MLLRHVRKKRKKTTGICFANIELSVGYTDLSAPEEKGFTQTHNVFSPRCLGTEWIAEVIT